MRLLTIFVLARSLAVVRASCFGSGPTVTADNIRDSLPSVCISLGGHFVKGEQRYQCVTDAAGIKWDFRLKHKGDSSREISNFECQDGFSKEITCEHGGRTGYKNWEYSADPNSGNCYGIVLDD
ncbi:hypothetical protein IFR05_001506 [Cadophora sp. M221]|nr:hypothetical protein IFR05_001506 [Cadophora sp. M221]